jgi:hypothetical protein
LRGARIYRARAITHRKRCASGRGGGNDERGDLIIGAGLHFQAVSPCWKLLFGELVHIHVILSRPSGEARGAKVEGQHSHGYVVTPAEDGVGVTWRKGIERLEDGFKVVFDPTEHRFFQEGLPPVHMELVGDG